MGATENQKFAFQSHKPGRLYLDDRYRGVYLTIWSMVGSKGKGLFPICLVEYKLVGELVTDLRGVYTVPEFRKLGMADRALNHLAYWEIQRHDKALYIYPTGETVAFFSKVFGAEYSLKTAYLPKQGHRIIVRS